MTARYTASFALLSGANAYAALGAQSWITRSLFAYAALSFGLVGCAYALNRPTLLLKHASGQISPLGRLLFLPYHALSGLALRVQCHFSRAAPFSWVTDSLLLGRVPLRADSQSLSNYGVTSVLDLTAEFGASRHVRELQYRNLPILDGLAPSLEQLKACVAWMNEQLSLGPVLVHCALGHGRSATVAAAFLVASQRVSSTSDATRALAGARPRIGLNRDQRAVLDKYVKAQR